MKDRLLENIKKFTYSANLIYNTQDYTSATILYFKAFFAILDLTIYEKFGRIPKDHTERFRILEEHFSELYILTDKLYPDYRDTYTHSLTKSTCDRIKENVVRIIKEKRIL